MKKNRVFAAAFFVCFLLTGCMGQDETQEDEISEKVWVGVVGFNDSTKEFALSNNLGEAKKFINELKSDGDGTPLCYAVSRSVDLLKENTEELDYYFVVSFTDGSDNMSSSAYAAGDPARTVDQPECFNVASADLDAEGVRSYALALGESAPIQMNMEKLATRTYLKASSLNALEANFKSISDKLLVECAQNVALVTNRLQQPKFFLLTQGISSATLKLENDVLTATGSGNSLDISSANSVVVGDKIRIPFIKIQRNNSADVVAYKRIEVKAGFVASPTDNFYKNTEDSSIQPDSGQKIGVVLVLDFTKSLENDAGRIKIIANQFIDSLKTIK